MSTATKARTLLERVDEVIALAERMGGLPAITAGTITQKQAVEINRAVNRLASLTTSAIGFSSTEEILELTDAAARALDQNLPTDDDRPF